MLFLIVDIGGFWFFDFENIEFVVKVLDVKVINDKFWVFYGFLFDVVYELQVVDIVIGVVKIYSNFVRNFGSVGDMQVFDV